MELVDLVLLHGYAYEEILSRGDPIMLSRASPIDWPLLHRPLRRGDPTVTLHLEHGQQQRWPSAHSRGPSQDALGIHKDKVETLIEQV